MFFVWDEAEGEAGLVPAVAKQGQHVGTPWQARPMHCMHNSQRATRGHDFFLSFLIASMSMRAVSRPMNQKERAAGVPRYWGGAPACT